MFLAIFDKTQSVEIRKSIRRHLTVIHRQQTWTKREFTVLP